MKNRTRKSGAAAKNNPRGVRSQTRRNNKEQGPPTKKKQPRSGSPGKTGKKKGAAVNRSGSPGKIKNKKQGPPAKKKQSRSGSPGKTPHNKRQGPPTPPSIHPNNKEYIFVEKENILKDLHIKRLNNQMNTVSKNKQKFTDERDFKNIPPTSQSLSPRSSNIIKNQTNKKKINPGSGYISTFKALPAVLRADPHEKDFKNIPPASPSLSPRSSNIIEEYNFVNSPASRRSSNL
tara:strand:+ start:455 stop:1153 length:699 start_codon:yes stop_codon:yes gene_type:complete